MVQELKQISTEAVMSVVLLVVLLIVVLLSMAGVYHTSLVIKSLVIKLFINFSRRTSEERTRVHQSLVTFQSLTDHQTFKKRESQSSTMRAKSWKNFPKRIGRASQSFIDNTQLTQKLQKRKDSQRYFKINKESTVVIDDATYIYLGE